MKLTPNQAREMPCPLARTMPDRIHKSSKGNCVAEKCPVWRWALLSDHRYLSAINRERALMAQEWAEKNPDAKKPKTPASFDKQATAKVTQNPTDYIIIDDDKDRGFCGLGGA